MLSNDLRLDVELELEGPLERRSLLSPWTIFHKDNALVDGFLVIRVAYLKVKPQSLIS